MYWYVDSVPATYFKLYLLRVLHSDHQLESVMVAVVLNALLDKIGSDYNSESISQSRNFPGNCMIG